jgi:hypothetical protein
LRDIESVCKKPKSRLAVGLIFYSVGPGNTVPAPSWPDLATAQLRHRIDRVGLKRRISLSKVHSGNGSKDDHDQQKPPATPL